MADNVIHLGVNVVNPGHNPNWVLCDTFEATRQQVIQYQENADFCTCAGCKDFLKRIYPELYTEWYPPKSLTAVSR